MSRKSGYRLSDKDLRDVGKRRSAGLMYLAIFLATGLTAGVAYRLLDWGAAVMSCRQYNAPDTFLAYCSSPQFGDYEHGAYYFGLEPTALDYLRQADVLGLGSSKAQ